MEEIKEGLKSLENGEISVTCYLVIIKLKYDIHYQYLISTKVQ